MRANGESLVGRVGVPDEHLAGDGCRQNAPAVWRKVRSGKYRPPVSCHRGAAPRLAHVPLARSQNRTVPSCDVVARRRPSGESKPRRERPSCVLRTLERWRRSTFPTAVSSNRRSSSHCQTTVDCEHRTVDGRFVTEKGPEHQDHREPATPLRFRLRLRSRPVRRLGISWRSSLCLRVVCNQLLCAGVQLPNAAGAVGARRTHGCLVSAEAR